MAHSKEAHGKVAAMPQFNKGHWTKNPGETECAGGRYASEMNTNEEYTKSVDKLASYVKSHRAECGQVTKKSREFRITRNSP